MLRIRVSAFVIATLVAYLVAGCQSSSSTDLTNDPATKESDVAETARADRPLSVASRSSPLAITSDGRWIIVANRQNDTVGIVEVLHADGTDNGYLMKELLVGKEPHSVVVSPDNTRAYVSNAAQGTVSVVALRDAEQHAVDFRVVATIPVGTEPRGIAITPNGEYLVVANFTAGSLSIVDTDLREVVETIDIGGNPYAVTISNDLDDEDNDETVFVTNFFGERVNNRQDGFDNAKQGVVHAIDLSGTRAPRRVKVEPLTDSGFTASRVAFCPQTAPLPDDLHSTVFCPDTAAGAENDVVAQGVYPNQLHGALLRGDRLFIPTIGASPAPPATFDVNVQPIINVVNTQTLKQETESTINLNTQLAMEPRINDTLGKLTRLFAGDIVAMDADRAGRNFLIVSRASNMVVRARLDEQGRLDLGEDIVRFRTGNIPTGVVTSPNGKRAYVYNEVNVSVTAIDLETDVVLEQDILAGEMPAVPSRANQALIGKLVFYSSLGVPGGRIRERGVRNFVPIFDRGKASRDGWSSCASCHPDGRSDNVTWMLEDGPRQTPSLVGFFSASQPEDQRIAGWSATRGSVTDFNVFIRNVMGGVGFSDGPSSEIYDHGPTKGKSDALDLIADWLKTLRAPIMPPAEDEAALANGREIFAQQCATCHGGAKWSKSRVVYPNDPTFDAPPEEGGVPRDANIVVDGRQLVSYSDFASGATLTFLNDVGTFRANSPTELRGTSPNMGHVALGASGYNSPSLIDVGTSAPYLHDGSAISLDEVFSRHILASESSIEVTLGAQDLEDLKAFLLTIGDSTVPLTSDADIFTELAGRR